MDNPRIYLWIGLGLLAWMNLVQWNRDYGAAPTAPPAVAAPASGGAAAPASGPSGQLPALPSETSAPAAGTGATTPAAAPA
ncbi:MAG TPA: hypothetical protein PLR35_16600, partial [Burkholderiaceae bacterium]|nr:hypothetical protein [Burkholderiaceae bacterium]